METDGDLANDGVADDRSADPRGPLSLAQVRAAGRAVLIGAVGLVSIQVVALLLAVPVVAVTGDLSVAGETLLSTVATGIGLGAFCLIVLSAMERDVSFLDVSVPDRRDVGYAVGGSVLLLAGYLGVSIALVRLGVAPSDHGISQRLNARNAEVVLALIPLSYLCVGPAEELVYRNVVQKSLYEEFTGRVAILIASLVFALVHLPAYAGNGSLTVGAVASLGLVFGLGGGLGWLYRRTDSVVVPAFAHGTFNAVQFLLLYLQLTGAVAV